MKIETPWGCDCMVQQLAYLLKVSKGEFSGLMIDKKHAEKHLSDYTLSKGTVFGNYYCYEAENIPLVEFELKNIWSTITPTNKDLIDARDIHDYYLNVLSALHADYLRGININPVVKE